MSYNLQTGGYLQIRGKPHIVEEIARQEIERIATIPSDQWLDVKFGAANRPTGSDIFLPGAQVVEEFDVGDVIKISIEVARLKDIIPDNPLGFHLFRGYDIYTKYHVKLERKMNVTEGSKRKTDQTDEAPAEGTGAGDQDSGAVRPEDSSQADHPLHRHGSVGEGGDVSSSG